MSILDTIKKKKPASKATAEKKETKALAVSGGAVSVAASRVLVRPLVSEKATTMTNVYSFIVMLKANKRQIARAIAAVYGVTPVKVHTVRVKGKIKTRGRSVGKRSDWKKALITLPSGKSIALHEKV